MFIKSAVTNSVTGTVMCEIDFHKAVFKIVHKPRVDSLGARLRRALVISNAYEEDRKIKPCELK